MYITLLKRAILILSFIVFLVLPASSQKKNFFVARTTPSWVVKINPETETRKPKEITDGYYLSLIEDQNHAELHENYRHVIRQIVSDAGVQNGSEISVTYDPSYQKLTFHTITIWRNNHPVDRLDAADFKVLQNEKDLSKFIYSGTYDAYIILDDIRKGDRIEYAYTLKGDNPIFGDKYTNDFYFEDPSSIGFWYVNLVTSQKRLLNFKNFNFNTPPKTSVKNGMKVYEWENRLTTPRQSASYEPSWYNSYKHTQVSEYQNWAEIVDWGLKTNAYPDLKTPLIDQKVAELQSKARNEPKKYIELATRFVQDEIRYMGIEMGQYSQRPNSPEKVYKQRYGDCKDKSLLLIYLLNKAHIEAYMAYVDTNYGKKTNDFLPNPAFFNHAVVVVTYKNVKTWIDPTISYQRGSFENIYFPDYGKGLVLKPGNNRPEDVISIPTGKLVANLTFIVGDTSSKGKTTLVIKSTYTDNYADKERGEIASNGLESTEKSYLDYIIKFYPDAEISSKMLVRDNEATNTFEITESYSIKNFWLKEEKKPFRNYIYFYGDLIQENIRTIKAKGRTEPIALKYPVNVEQNVFITLPFIPNSVNENKTVETEDYFFEFASFQHGRNIKLNYTYRSLNDHVASDDIDHYVKDTKKIDDLLSYSVTLNEANPIATPNPYTILAGFITLLVSGFYFLRILKKTAPIDLERMADARQIRGWLLVLAITVTISPLKLLINFYETNLFNQTDWESFSEQGNTFIWSLRAGIMLEAIVCCVQFAASILILCLFYTRRIEFPRLGSIFMLLSISLTIFDMLYNLGLSTLVKSQVDRMAIVSHLNKNFGANFYSVIIGIIWISYLKTSKRVKQTFLFTYPKSSWEDKLNVFKHERMASYYRNTNDYKHSDDNNDYLSTINLKKNTYQNTENQTVENPLPEQNTSPADQIKTTQDENL